MTASRAAASLLVLAGGLPAGRVLAVSVETLPVGEPGEVSDSRHGGYGSVGYTCNLGEARGNGR